ncbi:hypothetical protein [Gemmatimonas sp.]
MSAATVLKMLVCLDVLFVLMHAIGFLLRGEPFTFFNLDGEGNLPAWWSNAKFVMAGTLFGVLAVAKKSRALTPLVLCALLLALAADEIASIHERVGHLLADNVAGDVQFRRKDAFLWPLLFGLPVLIVGGFVLRTLAKERFLSALVWKRLTIALVTFFAGAVGVEVIAFNPFLPVAQGSMLYQGLATLEEGLEHAGSSLLVWAALTAFMERLMPDSEISKPA